MSIPPLVCSTPPPPDQCEDDKDAEDFDIQYNLSQDDDENYDYGNFSSYNHFQAAANENKKPDVPIIAKVIENNTNNESTKEENKGDIEIVLGNNNTSEIKLKLEEDISIEDLNLIVAQETIDRTNITETKGDGMESETVNNNIDCSTKEPDILDDNNIVIDDGLSNFDLTSSEQVLDPLEVLEPPNLEDLEIDEIPPPIDEVIEDERKVIHEYFTETVDFQQEIVKSECEQISENFVETLQLEQESILKESEEKVPELDDVDDDFGDFDDFQFASTDKPATLVDNCDNPWNSEQTYDNGFGEFKANFDDNETNIVKPSNIEHSKDKSEIQIERHIPVVHDDDDDFGDFDDFKSSNNENPVTADEPFTTEQVAVLNLQSDNESQLMESIEKILSSIFEEEIVVPENEFDGKLESFLSETWGHLLETDVRQPYIVNWNNSLGQQTLLKSLCIDSRNILFGPKWSNNMPKYAANLSTAPLQPQKQPASTATQSESLNQPDKPASKASSTWSDPFTSDGQESCNTDTAPTATENAAPAIRPTDLDILEAKVPSKSELFSSTINIQPLRQISLPDTHIFTPTDSETPRSKTIHYNNSPSVLLQQTVTENKNLPDNLEPQPSTSTTDVNDEYWEFQDFKGASDKPISAENQHLEKSDSVTSSAKITHGTQLLQPIRLDPIMPTLNWPDPGEVKETFDDFSDFVSNSTTSTWSNEKHDFPVAPVENSKSITEPETPGAIVRKGARNEAVLTTGDSFDDEFDTFQSALPTSKSTPEFITPNLNSEMTAQVNTSPQKTFDKIFPKIPKSETISFSNPIRPNSNLVQNPTPLMANSNMNTAEHAVKSLPVMPTVINSSLLQPTPASSSSTQSQQKSTQILQPLSLESYSQINWPNPGIDLQDLSRFNPVETLQSLKSDLSTNSQSKGASPVHQANSNNQSADDDIWGEFVSSKPKQQPLPKKTTFADDDEWTDFVSSPSVKPNGLNTISFNVHTNLSMQKTTNQGKFAKKNNQIQLDIPSLNYITPKASNHNTYNDRHFQNL